MQLDAVAWVDDVADVDGAVVLVEDDAAALRRRGAHSHVQEIGSLGVGSADDERLMGALYLRPIDGGKHVQRRMSPEFGRRTVEHVTSEMQVDEREGLGTAILDAA